MRSITLQIRLGKDRGDRILFKFLEQNKEGSSFTKEAKRLLIECVFDKLREQYGNNDLEEVEIYKRFILNETTNQQEQIPSSSRSDYQGRVDYQDLKWVNEDQENHGEKNEKEFNEFNDDDDCNITDI